MSQQFDKDFYPSRGCSRMNRYVAVLWRRARGTDIRLSSLPEPEWVEVFADTLPTLNEAIKEHMADPRNISCYVICAYETVRELRLESKIETVSIPVVTKKWTEVS